MDASSQTESLPTGSFNLKSVVEESKARIHSLTPEPPKNMPRRRGNPGGPRGPYKKTVEAQSASSQGPEFVNQAPQSRTPPPEIKKFLVTPLKMLSKIPAQKYGVDEIQFDTNEAEALAESIDGLIQAFIPDMESMTPKTAAVFNFGMISSTIFLTKYQLYNQQKATLKVVTHDTKETPTPKEVSTDSEPESKPGPFGVRNF